MANQQHVIETLLTIKREGIEKLVEYMETNGFFTSAGSTRFHGNYVGGLLDHCVNLYNLFRALCIKFNLDVSNDTLLICAFGHDLCKVGAYIESGNKFVWNKYHKHGHAKLSLEILDQYIKLTEQEREIIKFHMGPYHAMEFSENGEYTLAMLLKCWNTNKLSKLFYFCDDMVAQFKDIKK